MFVNPVAVWGKAARGPRGATTLGLSGGFIARGVAFPGNLPLSVCGAPGRVLLIAFSPPPSCENCEYPTAPAITEVHCFVAADTKLPMLFCPYFLYSQPDFNCESLSLGEGEAV